jgi:hypothetical protein
MADKKLFCVALIGIDIPDDLVNRYWSEIDDQITKLEKTYGPIMKIYHEANYLKGEEGLKNIRRISERSYQLVKTRSENGAELVDLEDKESFWQIADCQLFLALRFSSKEVLDKISKITPEIFELYRNSVQKRREYISKQIADTLKDGEAGILIMDEEERMKLQFPAEFDVILVRPPALGEIEKWQREQQKTEN